MKYLLFTEKPEGSPKISKNNYVVPTKCIEGWFVLIEFKQLCINFGWSNFTETESITPIAPKTP